jgi:hypothetical protein
VRGRLRGRGQRDAADVAPERPSEPRGVVAEIERGDVERLELRVGAEQARDEGLGGALRADLGIEGARPERGEQREALGGARELEPRFGRDLDARDPLRGPFAEPRDVDEPLALGLADVALPHDGRALPVRAGREGQQRRPVSRVGGGVRRHHEPTRVVDRGGEDLGLGRARVGPSDVGAPAIARDLERAFDGGRGGDRDGPRDARVGVEGVERDCRDRGRALLRFLVGIRGLIDLLGHARLHHGELHVAVRRDDLPPHHPAHHPNGHAAQLAEWVERGGEQGALAVDGLLDPQKQRSSRARHELGPHDVVRGARDLGRGSPEDAVVGDPEGPEALAALGERREAHGIPTIGAPRGRDGQIGRVERGRHEGLHARLHLALRREGDDRHPAHPVVAEGEQRGEEPRLAPREEGPYRAIPYGRDDTRLHLRRPKHGARGPAGGRARRRTDRGRGRFGAAADGHRGGGQGHRDELGIARKSHGTRAPGHSTAEAARRLWPAFPVVARAAPQEARRRRAMLRFSHVSARSWARKRRSRSRNSGEWRSRRPPRRRAGRAWWSISW